MILVCLIASSFGLLAQSDSIVVSNPKSQLIELTDILHLYKDYKIEKDSIWRVRTETGAILAEGNFVKQYRSQYDDYVLVKQGIHNYYSLSGSLILREIYLRGELVDSLSFK